MKVPLVSICLPLYNSAEYVQETITSVVAQTYGHWELIIVDDCSPDDTVAIVTALLAKLADRRIRFSQNASRLGMVGNWNRAVSEAAGEFIKVMGQDDLLSPDCIAAQCAVMLRHPDVSVVACARKVIDPRGRKVLVRSSHSHEGVYDGRKTIRRCLRTGTNQIGEPVAVMFRATTLGITDLFDPTIIYCTDLDLWLRLLGRGSFYYMEDAKASYRIHAAAATRTLESEVANDFFRLVQRMVNLGYFELSGPRKVWLAFKVRLLTLSRKLIYRVLARP